jgi:hypothetical protein
VVCERREIPNVMILFITAFDADLPRSARGCARSAMLPRASTWVRACIIKPRSTWPGLVAR